MQKYAPVEIVAEFELWRKIKDWQGSESWVHKSMLAGKRYAKVTTPGENNIYEKKNKKELEYRLSKLGDIYKQEFYRNRSNRKPDNILSNRELDLLALESMERSFAYKNSQTTEILSPSITNNEEHLDLSQGLIKSHSPVSKSTQSKKYLYTKWGVYEMPDPYKAVLKKGPRDDLKKA